MVRPSKIFNFPVLFALFLAGGYGIYWFLLLLANGDPLGRPRCRVEHSREEQFKAPNAQFRPLAKTDIALSVSSKWFEAPDNIDNLIHQRGVTSDPKLSTALGLRYAVGKGVEQDDTKALFWLENAAVQDERDAQFALGVLYATGRAVAQDNQAAASWYRKAAEQGQTAAQYNLGLLYNNGTGVVWNSQLAVGWWQKAADHSDAEALYNLGVLYADAQGVPRDYGRALALWEKAASFGNGLAKENLEMVRKLAYCKPYLF